jgi:hypothetical protein
MSKKSLQELYALSVCFAAALVVLFNGAMSLNYLVRMTNPSLTVSGYEYERSLSDDAYLRNWPERRPLPDPALVAKLRAETFDGALVAERQSARRDLIESLTYVVAGLAAFGIHWLLAKRARPSDSGVA